MTTAIIKHQFEDHAIAQRKEDGYVNLTQLCKAGGKDLFDYLRQDSTKDYLAGLSADTGIHGIADNATTPALVNRSRKGTWAHPEVAIDCAQWVSVKLRIWANRTLVKIISGQPVEQTNNLEQRVSAIESQMFRNQAALAPVVPEISKHNLARKLVDEQAARTKLQHQFIWREAYAELDYLFGYNVNNKTCKGTKLQRIEDDGQLDNLIAIMQKLWTPSN